MPLGRLYPVVGGAVERVMRIDGDRGNLGSGGAIARAYVEPAFWTKLELDENMAAEWVAYALAAAVAQRG